MLGAAAEAPSVPRPSSSVVPSRAETVAAVERSATVGRDTIEHVGRYQQRGGKALGSVGPNLRLAVVGSASRSVSDASGVPAPFHR